ncbi:hypothetical protein [Cognatiluteimonas weifangensis]|uniref:Uncharacterized protein n=1 Tax=Cognatiluteimonas weifangensis TaxID=2303539 RepID=A0A372DGP6_9GAMM|nr:hypothetical protein [Luteimonas weifangensis]RFP58035.1 hypothetical protein D0Y53_12420 [Luteimonas weifangensis]
MDLEKPNSAAEVLTSQERAKLEPLTHAGATTRRFMDRFRVGAFTLIGAYFGWRIAETYFGPRLVSIGIGFAAGLVVAVTFPGRKA